MIAGEPLDATAEREARAMAGTDAQPFVADARGVTLAVRLTPRAAENALGTAITLANGRSALAVRVAAPRWRVRRMWR